MGATEIARPDITRPDNAASDQTEVLEHGWTDGGRYRADIAMV